MRPDDGCSGCPSPAQSGSCPGSPRPPTFSLGAPSPLSSAGPSLRSAATLPKVRTAFRRDAPTLFQPGLEFVCFSVLRTVSGWMLSTIPHSTSRSANNLSVQRARPSGGSPQAGAIRWASAAPSSFLGRRRCCSLRPMAASTPSSTQRRRIRSTVVLAISRDRAASSSVRPPSFRTSSLGNRMRTSVYLYAAARLLETMAFSSCCSSVVSSIRYFLAGTTPLLGYNLPMPAEYTSCISIQ